MKFIPDTSPSTPNSGVRVTETTLITFSFKNIFQLAKLFVRSFESHSYLTGDHSLAMVTPAIYIYIYIYTYIFDVVNFDALAQASDFRIERRQVVLYM